MFAVWGIPLGTEMILFSKFFYLVVFFLIYIRENKVYNADSIFLTVLLFVSVQALANGAHPGYSCYPQNTAI